MKIVTVDLLESVLRTIIGKGPNKIYLSGQTQRYEKGDVMKYMNGDDFRLYVCKIPGDYTLPDNSAFRWINLGNFKE